MASLEPSDKDLSKRERELLDTLYRLGSSSAAEIRESLKNPPTYTAVRTHLSNLEQKGYVRFESDGTRYIYHPVVPREQMASSVITNVLETFFDSSIELAVATLINREEAKISQAQLDRLAEIIEEARREGR